MKRRTLMLMMLIGVLMMTMGAAFAQTGTPAPDKITVKIPGLFPEGIEWDQQGGRFLLGSLMDGRVIAVADDGTVTPFADAPEAGLVSLGLQIDTATNRLLVAYADMSVLGDPKATGRAALGIFDLKTAEKLQFVDLSGLYDGKHLANDIAVDKDGNAYVTDSFSPVIYKVTPDGKGEVFIEDAQLGDPNFGFGLNGIDYSPDGYLLATVDGTASLWKIPVDAPSKMTQVELSEPFGADGMVLTPDGKLAAMGQVVGADGKTTANIIIVTSDDGWKSAQIDQRFETDGVSTLAYRDGQIYAIYSLLNQLGGKTPPESFDIQRIEFPAM